MNNLHNIQQEFSNTHTKIDKNNNIRIHTMEVGEELNQTYQL